MLTELSSDWYWEQDERFRFTFLSGELREKTGIAVEEHIGKARWDMPALNFTEEDWARHRACLERHEEFHDFEMRRPDRDGRQQWVSVSGRPIFDADRRFLGYRGIGRNITEGKLDDRALHESLERYQALVKSVDGIVWEVDAKTMQFLFVSEKAERLLGYPLRRWREEPDFWRMHVHPDDRDWALAFCARETAEKRDHEFEYRMLAADGRVVWLRDLVTVVVEGGEATRLRGIMIDVTPRKQAERSLRESEDRYRELIDLSPDAIFVHSDWRIVLVNQAGLRLFGAARPEELLGREVLELIAPQSRKAVRRRIARLYDERLQVPPVEVEYVRADGTCFSAEVTAASFLYAGRPAAQVVARDIGERKNADRLLRQSEQRFQRFMENAPANAWINDSQGRFIYGNSPFLHTCGKSLHDVLGRTSADVWPAEAAKRLREQDEQVLRTGEPAQGVVSVPDADGKDTRWLVVKFPLPDPTGAVGVAGMAIDITERVSAVARLRESRKRIRNLLNRLVAVQEAERRRLAGELHDLIGQKITALGIELNALRHELPIEPGDALDSRLDSLTCLLEETVDEIRRLMKDLRPAVLDEHGLLPALHWYARQFESHTGMRASVAGAELHPRPAPGVELALFRIVQEALANAAKHSRASRVEIFVERSAASLRVTVEDDGVGFCEPEAPTAGAQSGWGLPAMHERAEVLGGKLRVESPGAGARIVVEIPHADPRHPG